MSVCESVVSCAHELMNTVVHLDDVALERRRCVIQLCVHLLADWFFERVRAVSLFLAAVEAARSQLNLQIVHVRQILDVRRAPEPLREHFRISRWHVVDLLDAGKPAEVIFVATVIPNAFTVHDGIMLNVLVVFHFWEVAGKRIELYFVAGIVFDPICVNSNREVSFPNSISIAPIILERLVVRLAGWNRHRHSEAVAHIRNFSKRSSMGRSNVVNFLLAVFFDREMVDRKVIVLSLVSDETSWDVGIGHEHWYDVVSVGAVLALAGTGGNCVASFPLEVDQIVRLDFNDRRAEVVLDCGIRLSSVASSSTHSDVVDFVVIWDAGRAREKLEYMSSVLECASELRSINRQLQIYIFVVNDRIRPDFGRVVESFGLLRREVVREVVRRDVVSNSKSAFFREINGFVMRQVPFKGRQSTAFNVSVVIWSHFWGGYLKKRP